MKGIVTERYKFGEIPVLALIPEGVEKAPVVFFYHGCGARKEQGQELGEQLAQQGFYFVAVDAYLHGEREDQRLLNALEKVELTYPADTWLDLWSLMFESIYQTGNELYQLIDHLAKDQRADVKRVGVTGLSMGGYISQYLAGFNSHVQVAVPMIGLGTFEDRHKDVMKELNAEWAKELQPFEEQLEHLGTFIRQIDPHPMLRKFAPKPLLMLNGEQDLDQPKEYSIKLHQQLQPYYRKEKQPDQLRLQLYEGVGHQVTAEMRQEAVEWFKRYL